MRFRVGPTEGGTVSVLGALVEEMDMRDDDGGKGCAGVRLPVTSLRRNGRSHFPPDLAQS